MATRFTLGIEEEFQMVDRRTGQLRPCIQVILAKGSPIFGEQLKPEQHQCMVELNSEILPDISTARQKMGALRAKLARLLDTEGLALISAGTHPAALSREEPISPYERYARMEAEFQDVTRNHLIFGLHIHIGVKSRERAVALMKSTAYLATPFAGPLDQLTFLGWRPVHWPQIVSLRRVENNCAQWNTRGLPVLERLGGLYSDAGSAGMYRRWQEDLVGYPPPSNLPNHRVSCLRYASHL